MEHTKLAESIVKELTDRLGEADFKNLIEATTKASDEDTGTFEVVITTENIDRMGEVIKVDGWELDNYMKNPVVLWGHSHYDLPVGVCTSIEKVGSTLIAKGKFAPEDANPKGQNCRRLYDLGILRATSVGFIEKEREGNLITKAELIEFSFVSVPANPFCLSTIVKSNLSIDEFVTKGLIFIKSEEEEETPADPVEEPVVDPVDDPVVDKIEDEVVDDPVVEGDPDEGEDPVDDELSDDEKAIALAVSALKDATSALEALVSKGKEPERKEDETTEERSFRLFTEGRKFAQLASAAMSESLAEARKAVSSKI